MNEFISKNYPSVTWTCLQYDNYTYDYIVDLGDYAKIDEMNKMWAEKMKTVNPDDFKKYADAFIGTISATNQFVVTLEKKGSYKAKDPFVKQGEGKFYHWDYFEFIPGKSPVNRWTNWTKNLCLMSRNLIIGMVKLDQSFQ